MGKEKWFVRCSGIPYGRFTNTHTEFRVVPCFLSAYPVLRQGGKRFFKEALGSRNLITIAA
jgi:hypothetical protein